MKGEGMDSERHALCLAIDEELHAFLRCVDNYETATREVSPSQPMPFPVHESILVLSTAEPWHRMLLDYLCMVSFR
jgi:hypothetical protein